MSRSDPKLYLRENISPGFSASGQSGVKNKKSHHQASFRKGGGFTQFKNIKDFANRLRNANRPMLNPHGIANKESLINLLFSFLGTDAPRGCHGLMAAWPLRGRNRSRRCLSVASLLRWAGRVYLMGGHQMIMQTVRCFLHQLQIVSYTGLASHMRGDAVNQHPTPLTNQPHIYRQPTLTYWHSILSCRCLALASSSVFR